MPSLPNGNDGWPGETAEGSMEMVDGGQCGTDQEDPTH